MSTSSKNLLRFGLVALLSIPGGVASSLAQNLQNTSPMLASSLTILATLVAGVVGLRGNRLAAKSDAEENAAPASLEVVGMNHHLARMAGHSLRTIMEKAAKARPVGSDERLALENAMLQVVEVWLKVLEDPSGGDFRQLDSSRLGDIAAGQSMAHGGMEVLTVEQWLPFSRYLLGESGANVQPSALATELARRFKKDFAGHFLEHAKHSAQSDPPAFAALLIQFLAEMRFTQREFRSEFAGIHEQIEEVRTKFDSLAKTIVTNLGFSWERLTKSLEKSTFAHEEAKRFYASQQRNWDELLPLTRHTYQLLESFASAQEVRSTQLREGQEALLRAVADIDQWLKEKVRDLLADYQLGKVGRESTVTHIVDSVLRQREKPKEMRRSFELLEQRRRELLTRTARPYQQSEDWSPGRKATEARRATPPALVVRPPLTGKDDTPPPGSNLYLHGKSGHGKSTLADAIAHRLAKKHYVVLTLNLRNETDTVRQKLAELAGPDWLKLAPPDELIDASQPLPKPDGNGLWPETDIDGRVVAVEAWLRADRGEAAEGRPPKHPRFVLVWDNVDDPYTLDYILRLHLLNHGGVQIITSRIPPVDLPLDDSHPYREGLPGDFRSDPVNPYSQSEAEECLRLAGEMARKHGGCEPPGEIVKRILEVARLAGDPPCYDPLILGHKIKIGRKARWELEDLLKPSEIEGLECTLARVSPLANAVWRLLVHLAAAPIPQNFWEPIENELRSGVEISETERAKLAENFHREKPLDHARAELADAGILNRGDAVDFIHARYLSLGRDLTPKAALPAIHRRLVRILYAAAPRGNPNEEIGMWPFYRAGESHLLAALSAERAKDILRIEETVWLTNRLNAYLVAHARLKEAVQIAHLTVECAAAVHGRESEELAKGLHELASVQLADGRYWEAEGGLKKVVSIYVAHQRESDSAAQRELERDPAVAAAQRELARVQFAQGRYLEAETDFKKALVTFTKCYGENDPWVTTTQHELARVQLEQGKYREAETGFEKALAIYGCSPSSTRWELAMMRSHRAHLWWVTGREEDARRQFADTLTELELQFGPEHPRIALLLSRWTACELGHVPGQVGAPKLSEEGMDRLRRALKICEAKLRPGHPDAGEIRLLLAEALRRRGDLASARTEATEAAAMLRAALPQEHPSIRRAEALLQILEPW